ncbi:MAG: winged helix-turn-helix domain-containing protein [Prevotella sp.]|nr:winged helix-turn-helix domain-containing protein [Prevotella sp.]
MAEKKVTTKKATETKATAAKKTTTVKKAAAPKVAAKKDVLAVNAENIGFKAGDVYQALAAAEKPLSVKEIAKAAKISEEETLLGLGWLFKEGKLVNTEDKITLA